MARIRNRNTGPELPLRSALHRRGFRFRLHSSKFPGKPDIVLSKYKTVIFVHGCFWHRHAHCKAAAFPKSNTEFWAKKFAENVERDAKNVRVIESCGWRVFTVWECELTTKRIGATVDTLGSWIGRDLD